MATRASRFKAESDPHFLESTRKEALGGTAGASAAKALGITASNLIDAEAPKPAAPV